MMPCVHLGSLLSRGCGCKGQRTEQDDIYRCWLGGESGQCVPEAKVLPVSVLTAAGYRICQTCESRQEPVRLERPPEPPQATRYERGPVRWEYIRQMRAARLGLTAVPWVGSTDLNAEEPPTKIDMEVPELRTPVVRPLVVYRVDMSRCAPHFHQFNASILNWRGERLMAYRHGWGGARIRLCTLDGNYVALQDREVDVARTPYNELGDEDPRLFVFRGQPHISFNGVTRKGSSLRTHMMYAALDPETLKVTAHYVVDYPQRRAWEKNWLFYEQDGGLYCIYELFPRTTVLKIDGHQATLHSRTDAPATMPAACGIPRGGAPPTTHEFENWIFYHGVQHHKGRRYYGLGLCTSEWANVPTRITRQISGPLMWADEEDRWAPHHPSVVYPAGAVKQGNLWLVSMGYQDRWSEVAIFSHKELEAALVSV